MKRDMDLVRHILMAVEDSRSPVSAEDIVAKPWTMDDVFYHIRLMEAHGLLDAGLLDADDSPYYCVVSGLTWEGSDFLDAIRDDGIWKKTKAVVRGVSSSVTMQTIRETAVLVASQAIKASLGL